MNNDFSGKMLPGAPAPAQGEVIAEFSEYKQAVKYVERLIAKSFPPGMIAIVGKDLRSVERVRGKLSYARAALSGATMGVWLGLALFILFGSAQSLTLGACLFLGAGTGMLIALLRYSASSRKRAFFSQHQIVAANYQVQVPANLVSKARDAAAE